MDLRGCRCRTRARRSPRSSPAGASRACAPAMKPAPSSYASAPPKMNPRASAPRIRSGSRGRAQSASWRIDLREVLRVGDQRHEVLEEDPFLREVRDVADLVAEIERHDVRSDDRRGGRAGTGAARAPARRAASASRSSSASLRRSGLRERRPGATSCSTSAACRPAAVRNVRRCRASMPKRASRAHAAATSASLSP